MTGIVYTETTIYTAPEAFVSDAPYQTAIVVLDGGGRTTGRILGDRVSIDDRVEQVDVRKGIPFFRKVGGDKS